MVKSTVKTVAIVLVAVLIVTSIAWIITVMSAKWNEPKAIAILEGGTSTEVVTGPPHMVDRPESDEKHGSPAGVKQPTRQERALAGQFESFKRMDEDAQLADIQKLRGGAVLAQGDHDRLLLILDDPGLDVVIKNQAANALMNADPIRADFVEKLQSVVRDPAESDRWRDYALQHLGVACVRMDENSAGIACLHQAFIGSTSTLPGTAFLALGHLVDAERYTFTEQDHVRIDHLMTSAHIDSQARLTVITGVGDAGWSEHHQRLRDLCEGETDPELIRAAIIALSKYHNSDDISLIQLFEEHPLPRVASAARESVAVCLNKPLRAELSHD